MADLTERQQQVASLVARGLPDKAIARELSIAPGTVRKHVERISDRLPGPGTRRMRIALFILDPARPAA